MKQISQPYIYIKSLSLTLLLAFTFPYWVHAQPKDKIRNKETKAYLFGKYIPKDINDACLYLDKLISVEARQNFISLPEEEAAKKLFFGFGKWIRINWNIDDVSRFTVFFNKKGLTFPDDILFATMISYHRHLSKKDIDLDKIIDFYKKERKEKIRIKKERDAKSATTTIIKKD